MLVYSKRIRVTAGLTLSLIVAVVTSMLLVSCGGESGSRSQSQEQNQQATPAQNQPASGNTSEGAAGEQMPPKPALSNSYFVLDQKTNTVFELNRNSGEVLKRYIRKDPIVAVAFDTDRNQLYEAVGGKKPGFKVFDLSKGEYIEQYEFPDEPSGMFFHPTQHKVYVVSPDSSAFHVYEPDSSKFTFEMTMRIHNDRRIGPSTIAVGPLNKLVMADTKMPAVTQVLTENKFMYQTVIIHDANEITSAAFAFDGNSAFVTDTEQGAIFRIEFGSGKYLAEKFGLKRPRLVRFEVSSQTVCVVENDVEVAFYNPDTFAETGRVNLQQYGDKILSLEIPPHSNYAELLLDYKGVTRWLIVDIRNWEMLRFAELI